MQLWAACIQLEWPPHPFHDSTQPSKTPTITLQHTIHNVQAKKNTKRDTIRHSNTLDFPSYKAP